jgi:flagellar biogenesis protein FliO
MVRAQRLAGAVLAMVIAAAACQAPSASACAQAAGRPEAAPQADPDSTPPGDLPAEDQSSPEEGGLYQYEEPEFGEARVSYPMMVLRTIGIMGAVIIGLFLLYRLLIKKRNRIVTDSRVVNVLATYPLAANRTIQVVDIAGKVLVLGVSDAAVNLITQVDDQETIDRIRLLSEQERGGQGRFKDQLARLLGGGFSQAGKTSRPGQVSQLSGYRRRIERMQDMK